MWKCPVCDKENTAATVCPRCGYDRTCDYEQYPTAFAVTTATPTHTLRRAWQAKQGPGLMELVMRWFDAPQDTAAAERCFRRLADGGDPAAQWWLGTAYARGWGAEKDEAQAVEWFRKAARQGYAPAQRKTGSADRTPEQWYEQYEKETDRDRRLVYLKKAAEQDHAEAQCQLGDCFYLGQGVEKDLAQAAHWYRKAAEQGHVGAQLSLADCYANGWGVPKDPGQAAWWRDKATGEK